MSSLNNALASIVAIAGACNLVAASPYMHGVTTTGATVVRMDDAAGSSLASSLCDREVDAQEVDAPNAGVPLRIGGDITSVTLPQSIISADEIANYAGRTLRVFAWIRGDEITAQESLWMGAPSMKLELYDGLGNIAATAESLFKTRGTFPWHCYYLDIAVPKNVQFTDSASKKGGKKKAKDGAAATDNDADQLAILSSVVDNMTATVTTSRKPGLYLTLSNYGGGYAWFAGLSYAAANDAAGSRVAENGCYAPNADYDELPMMLFFGVDAKQKWSFLNGNSIQGSLLSVEGIRTYLKENGHDWLHLQCGIANLPFIYNTAGKNAAFDDGWMDAFAAGLEELQDPSTGFWLVNGKINILANAALVNGCYAPTAISHAGIVIETPQYSMGANRKLKYADKMIATLLFNRISEEILAWSADDSDNVDMATTAAACQLLARAADALGEADPFAVKAREAIADAWKCAQRNLMVNDGKGLWKDNSLSNNASATGKGFLELVEATTCLDDCYNDALPRPQLEATISESDANKVVVQWRKPEKELVAVRVFYGPKPGKKSKGMSNIYLVGIIERRAGADAIQTVRKSVEAGRRQWGITPEKVGAYYLDAKIKALPKKYAVALAGKGTLKASVPADLPAEATDMGFYACGVNAAGEMGPAFPIGAGDDTEEMIAAEEEAAAEAEDLAAEEAAEAPAEE